MYEYFKEYLIFQKILNTVNVENEKEFIVFNFLY